MKNTCGKTVKPSEAYQIWQTPDKSWTWKVCKMWQADDNKPFARWFCLVTSPFCLDGEWGDCYVKDIKSQAIRVS